jgi:hypothetical protein
MSDTPPMTWFEENFVHDGNITYCDGCNSIPFAFIGHWCTGLEAHAMGCAASKVTVPYRPEDVVLVESDDRPGDWRGVYVPVAASGDAP